MNPFLPLVLGEGASHGVNLLGVRIRGGEGMKVGGNLELSYFTLKDFIGEGSGFRVIIPQ